MTFLGGIIFKHGHAICPDKVKAIVDMAPPKDKTGVKSFLGSVNFFQHFCKDLSGAALPLKKITSTKVPFVWTEVKDSAFHAIKNALLNAPILAHPDLTFLLLLKEKLLTLLWGSTASKTS